MCAATNFVPLNCKSQSYSAWPTNHCIVLVLQVTPENCKLSENVGTKLRFIFMDNYKFVKYSLDFSWLSIIHVRNFTNSVLSLRSSSICVLLHRQKFRSYVYWTVHHCDS